MQKETDSIVVKGDKRVRRHVFAGRWLGSYRPSKRQLLRPRSIKERWEALDRITATKFYGRCI